MNEAYGRDISTTRTYYRELYKKHGYSPKSLGWNKGRQPIRFAVLLSEFLDIESPRILDIGCGFGDINLVLKETFAAYEYMGVDLTEEPIYVAQDKFAGEKHISFQCGDFLEAQFESTFDIVVASGIFNTKFASNDTNNLSKIHSRKP